MSSPEEMEEPQKYRSEMYSRVIPVFLVLNAIAFTWNCVVIWALRRTRLLNGNLILSLTISDAWTTLIIACSLLYNSFLPIVLNTNVNPCASLTLEILRTSGLLTGTCQLLLISLHHFILIVYPHADRKLVQRVVGLVSLACWVYPLVILVALSLAYENEGYYNCQNVRFYHSRAFRSSVSFFLLFVFLCIIYFYVRLLFILRAQSKKWRSKNTQTRASRENRTLWTAVMICSSFFIGWAPATVHFFSTCSTCELLRNSNFRTLFFLSCFQLTFLVLKSFVNPVIYATRIPEVDAQIRSLASECCPFLLDSKKNKKVRSLTPNEAPRSPRPEDGLLGPPPPTMVDFGGRQEKSVCPTQITRLEAHETTVRLSIPNTQSE